MSSGGFEVIYGVDTSDVEHVNFEGVKVVDTAEVVGSNDEEVDYDDFFEWLRGIDLIQPEVGDRIGIEVVILFNSDADSNEFNPLEAVKKWDTLVEEGIIVLKEGAKPRFYATRFWD